MYFYLFILNFKDGYGDIDAFELLDNYLIFGDDDGKYHIIEASSTYYNEKISYRLTDQKKLFTAMEKITNNTDVYIIAEND